jgi:DNA-directed RNA polymerase specialized sigma24 family protein
MTLDDRIAECRRVALLESRRRGLSQEDAEDVAQEVCLSLWKLPLCGELLRSVGGWSRVAAARRILKVHRDSHTLKRGGGIVESLTGVDEMRFAT